MDFFRRIGADRHKFKVEFFIGKISCNAKLKGQVYVSIKRGDHKLSTQNKLKLESDGTCNFNKQILTFESLTLFYDQDDKQYQEKQGQIRIIIITNKGDKKLLGSIIFDVASYANDGKQSYQQIKTVGEKIKVTFQYQVYVKYLGQASQTSKSVDNQLSKKQNEKKKQSKEKDDKSSSLSKFMGIFKSNSPQSSPKQVENQGQEKKKIAKNKEDSGSRQKQKKTAKDYNKYPKKQSTSRPKQENTKTKQSVSRTEHAKNETKRRQQSESSSQNEGQTRQNPKKNHVHNKKKTTMSQWESQPKQKNRNTVQDSPASNPIYIDEYYRQNKQTPHKMMKTQKVGNVSHNQDDSFFTNNDKIDSGAKLRPVTVDKKTENIQENIPFSKQIALLKTELAQKNSELSKNSLYMTDMKQKLKSISAQNKELKQRVKILNSEKEQIQKKLQKNQNKKIDERPFFETQRDFQDNNGKINNNDEKLRSLERQKGELLVKLQNQKSKYDKDFEKYQEVVDKLEQQKKQLEKASKAELTRLKEQFQAQKQQYDKLMEKYEQRANQTKKIRQKENQLKDQLAIAQNSLSVLKLKIGERLNLANQDADRSVIDILTELNES